jgi:gamma-glutamyltranspeptidase / glutathione hydrolase / leukotriene-C4 hydrolase
METNKSLYGHKVLQLVLYILILDAAGVEGYEGAIGNFQRQLISPFVEHLESHGTPDLSHIYPTAAVSAEVPLCSRLGTEKLKQGGNAVDAAITAAICVGIINSFSSGIGGGGFILIRKPGSEEVLDMIDFRETAPENIFVAQMSSGGYGFKIDGLAIGVPGEVRGLLAAHKKYGKLPWKELFRENIEIAKGFRATNQLAKRLSKYRDLVMADTGLREIYTRNSELLKEGDVVRRPNLARTLERIADNPESFYEGDLASDVVKAVRLKGGILNKDDLAAYRPKHRDVLRSTYYDYNVYTTSLPTSGLLVIEALNILENFNLKEIAVESQRRGEYGHLHLLIEVFKFAMARRGELGDPDFLKGYKDVVDEITSKETAEKIARKISLDGVLKKEEYGARSRTRDDHGTTHINVVDKDEMVALVTSTVNLEFGAKFMDPRTGIIFNNQLDDFFSNIEDVRNPRPDAPNSVQPGKRPLSSASPVLLIKNDEILALGAAGGMRIPTSIIGVLLYLSTGSSLRDAITATRIHNQLDPEITYVEGNIDQSVVDYFLKLGHKVEKSLQNSVFTSVQGILLRRNGGGRKSIHAVSDPRKGGEASGY